MPKHRNHLLRSDAYSSRVGRTDAEVPVVSVVGDKIIYKDTVWSWIVRDILVVAEEENRAVVFDFDWFELLDWLRYQPLIHYDQCLLLLAGVRW